MKIIVSGGCGFIGSNFVLKMASNESNKLLIIDKLTYAGNQNNLSSIKHKSNYTFIRADICDRKPIEYAINNFQPDAIVHFAAESHVDNSISGPMGFINTNILGTAMLLDICQSYIKSQNNNYFKFFYFVMIKTINMQTSMDENMCKMIIKVYFIYFSIFNQSFSCKKNITKNIILPSVFFIFNFGNKC